MAAVRLVDHDEDGLVVVEHPAVADLVARR
jgi:hypothetical protein